MAIGEDRVGIQQITQASQDSFTVATESASNQSSLDYGDNPVKPFVADMQNKVGSAFTQATSGVQGIFDKLQSGINGVQGKAKDVLNNVPQVKNLNVDTSSLGLFENVLCGKLPSLNISLPGLKVDFLRDWLDWNFTVCGKTEKINPFDTAMSIVDTIQNPQATFNKYIAGNVSKYINQELTSLTSKFGFNVNDCLTDRSKWDLLNENMNGFGSSLEDRDKLFGSTSKDKCNGAVMDALGVPRSIKRAAFSNFMDSVAGNNSRMATNVFNKHVDSLSGQDKATAVSAIPDMMIKNSTNGNNKKLDFIADTMVPADKQDEFYKRIINQAGPIPDDNWTSAGGIKATDRSYLRCDCGKLSGMFDNMTDKELANIKPESLIITSEIMDPNWSKDENGNTNLYKVSGIKAYKNASDNYLATIRPKTVDIPTVTNNIDNQSIDSGWLPLDGSATTELSLLHEINILSQFKTA